MRRTLLRRRRYRPVPGRCGAGPGTRATGSRYRFGQRGRHRGYVAFHDLDFAEWQRVVDVNLNGVFHCVQAVLPDMLTAGWGRIVNISSSSTHSGTPMRAHYVAAKSAVNGLTKVLALEYGPHGITVNAVPPGFIDTPMLRNAERRGDFGHLSIDDLIAATP